MGSVIGALLRPLLQLASAPARALGSDQPQTPDPARIEQAKERLKRMIPPPPD